PVAHRLRRTELLIERGHCAGGDFVDQMQEIVAAAVDRVSPDAISGPRIGELQIHANEIAGSEEVAFEDSINLQLLPGSLRVDRPLLSESENRGRRPHMERRDLLKVRRERVGETDR